MSPIKEGYSSSPAVTLFEDKLFEGKDSPRSLLVRNFNRSLKPDVLAEEFERYGAVHCFNSRHLKDEGFVVADYFDARDCFHAFKGFSKLSHMTQLCQPGARLDVHYFASHINDIDNPFANEGKVLIQGLPREFNSTELQVLLQHFGDIKKISSPSRGLDAPAWIVEYYDIRSAAEAQSYLSSHTIDSQPLYATFLNGYTSWASAGFAPSQLLFAANANSANSSAPSGEYQGSGSRRPSYSYPFPSPLSSRPQSRSPSPTRCSSPPLSRRSSAVAMTSPPSVNASAAPASQSSSGNQRYLPSPPSSPPTTSLSAPRPASNHHQPLNTQQGPAAPHHQQQGYHAGVHHQQQHHHHHGHHSVDSKHHPNRIPDNFQIDLDAIRNGHDRRTTLMVRNIPNKYTQDMFLEFVNETHKGKYDFIYLPIDFKNKCNVGYAFINFIDPVSIIGLFNRIQGKKWTRFNSEKICAVSYARIQGKENLIRHFQNSTIMSECADYRPKIFHSTGALMGLEEPFPEPNVTYVSYEQTQACSNQERNFNGQPQNHFLDKAYYPNFLS